MALTRADKRARLARAKRLVSTADLSDRVRDSANKILNNGPTTRQVTVIINLALRKGGTDEQE